MSIEDHLQQATHFWLECAMCGRVGGGYIPDFRGVRFHEQREDVLAQHAPDFREREGKLVCVPCDSMLTCFTEGHDFGDPVKLVKSTRGAWPFAITECARCHRQRRRVLPDRKMDLAESMELATLALRR